MAYTSAVYFLDYTNGSDAARADLVPSAYANNGAGLVRVTVGGLGTPAIVTDAVVDIAGTSGSVYVGAWKVTVIDPTTIDLQGSTYTSNPATKGTCTPRGGCAWGANAWKTIASGATSARIAAGDTIRIAKSPSPYSIGSATWTTGPLPAALSSPTTDTSTPIVMTKAGHTFVAGDVVQVVGHSANVGTNGANGVWIVGTVVGDTFQLLGTTPLAGAGSGGTVQLINAKTVKLASALTTMVDRCEVAWSPAGGVTPTRVGIATDCKEGDACVQITAPASPATGTMYGYIATSGSLNLSSRQVVTFWIKNEAAILANHWNLCFCSGTDGTGVVNTFPIPAIPATGYWVPLTINANEGANLYNGVQSVALYSGSVAPTASKYVRLDNIEAAASPGLNLQSFISKNTAEYGGSEPWFPVQSINGTVVLLDANNNAKANAGQGYYGTSGAATTYARETTKLPAQASYFTTTKGGSDGSPIVYSGGWNTSTGFQDGMSLLDTWMGHTAVVVIGTGHNFLNWDRIGFFRGSANLYYTQMNQFTNCWFNAALGVGIGSSGSTGSCSLSDCIACCNSGYGVDVYHNFVVSNTISISNLSSGFNLWTWAKLNNSFSYNNAGSGIRFSGGNASVYNTVTAANAQSGVGPTNTGLSYLNRCTINETSEFLVSGLFYLYTPYMVFSQDHDGTVGNVYVCCENGAYIATLSSTRPGGSGLMWKLAPVVHFTNTSGYRLPLKIAHIAVAASKLVTIKCWMQKGHATNVGGRLSLLASPENQLLGITTDTYTTKANDTNWEELTVTFTPTVAGVVEVTAEAYYVAGLSYIYVDDITITQVS